MNARLFLVYANPPCAIPPSKNILLISTDDSGVPPAVGVGLNSQEGGKMDSVIQSIHLKCQCVIDCPSLAPRCCPQSDQYHHYPNYAAGLARSPLN